jgi:hypothetical protein
MQAIGRTLLFWGIGVIFGLVFPDLDLKLSQLPLLGFMLHRSIITHGFVLPLLVFLLVEAKDTVRPFILGLNLSLAAHFCFDLFPNAWLGYSLIYVPFYGRTSPVFSWLWLTTSVLICLYLAIKLVKTKFDFRLAMMGIAIAFWYNMVNDEFRLAPLAAITIGLGVTWLKWPLTWPPQFNQRQDM